MELLSISGLRNCEHHVHHIVRTILLCSTLFSITATRLCSRLESLSTCRACALIFEKHFSMGLSIGEYGGRNLMITAKGCTTSRTSWVLCMAALSITKKPSCMDVPSIYSTHPSRRNAQNLQYTTDNRQKVFRLV